MQSKVCSKGGNPWLSLNLSEELHMRNIFSGKKRESADSGFDITTDSEKSHSRDWRDILRSMMPSFTVIRRPESPLWLAVEQSLPAVLLKKERNNT